MLTIILIILAIILLPVIMEFFEVVLSIAVGIGGLVLAFFVLKYLFELTAPIIGYGLVTTFLYIPVGSLSLVLYGVLKLPYFRKYSEVKIKLILWAFSLINLAIFLYVLYGVIGIDEAIVMLKTYIQSLKG